MPAKAGLRRPTSRVSSPSLLSRGRRLSVASPRTSASPRRASAHISPSRESSSQLRPPLESRRSQSHETSQRRPAPPTHEVYQAAASGRRNSTAASPSSPPRPTRSDRPPLSSRGRRDARSPSQDYFSSGSLNEHVVRSSSPRLRSPRRASLPHPHHTPTSPPYASGGPGASVSPKGHRSPDRHRPGTPARYKPHRSSSHDHTSPPRRPGQPNASSPSRGRRMSGILSKIPGLVTFEGLKSLAEHAETAEGWADWFSDLRGTPNEISELSAKAATARDTITQIQASLDARPDLVEGDSGTQLKKQIESAIDDTNDTLKGMNKMLSDLSANSASKGTLLHGLEDYWNSYRYKQDFEGKIRDADDQLQRNLMTLSTLMVNVYSRALVKPAPPGATGTVPPPMPIPPSKAVPSLPTHMSNIGARLAEPSTEPPRITNDLSTDQNDDQASKSESEAKAIVSPKPRRDSGIAVQAGSAKSASPSSSSGQEVVDSDDSDPEKPAQLLLCSPDGSSTTLLESKDMVGSGLLPERPLSNPHVEKSAGQDHQSAGKEPTTGDSASDHKLVNPDEARTEPQVAKKQTAQSPQEHNATDRGDRPSPAVSDTAAAQGMKPAQESPRPEKNAPNSVPPEELLLDAAWDGKLDVCTQALRHAPVNSSDSRGLTALHLACERDHLAIAIMLLDHGADVEARAKGGRSPLHLAARFASAETVEMLLERGHANALVKTSDGRTALHYAASAAANGDDERREVIRVLRDWGADPTAEDRKGETPRDVAQKRDYWDAAATLKRAERKWEEEHKSPSWLQRHGFTK